MRTCRSIISNVITSTQDNVHRCSPTVHSYIRQLHQPGYHGSLLDKPALTTLLLNTNSLKSPSLLSKESAVSCVIRIDSGAPVKCASFIAAEPELEGLKERGRARAGLDTHRILDEVVGAGYGTRIKKALGWAPEGNRQSVPWNTYQNYHEKDGRNHKKERLCPSKSFKRERGRPKLTEVDGRVMKRKLH